MSFFIYLFIFIFLMLFWFWFWFDGPVDSAGICGGDCVLNFFGFICCGRC